MVKSKIYKYYNQINKSKLLAGLSMLILNLFSKYVQINFSKTQEEYFKSAITREIFIFTILFVGTQDIITSLILTASFLILSDTIFNEKSKLCMIPKKFLKLEKALDINNDNYISEKEINRAKEILKRANVNNF